jgi:hypothetical protein
MKDLINNSCSLGIIVINSSAHVTVIKGLFLPRVFYPQMEEAWGVCKVVCMSMLRHFFEVLHSHIPSSHCVEQSWWGWLVFRWPKLSFYLDGMPYLTRTIHFYFNGGSLIFSALMAWTHQAIVSIIIECDTKLFLKWKELD